MWPVVTFESVDEALVCDHSNESYRVVLSSGAVCFWQWILQNEIQDFFFCFDLSISGLFAWMSRWAKVLRSQRERQGFFGSWRKRGSCVYICHYTRWRWISARLLRDLTGAGWIRASFTLVHTVPVLYFHLFTLYPYHIVFKVTIVFTILLMPEQSRQIEIMRRNAQIFKNGVPGTKTEPFNLFTLCLQLETVTDPKLYLLLEQVQNSHADRRSETCPDSSYNVNGRRPIRANFVPDPNQSRSDTMWT